MSQVRNEATNLRPNAEFATGNEQYPPQWAQNRAPQPEGQSDFVDGSGPIFSMYLEMAEQEDKKMTESWTADAKGILFFTGLFSASVASLLSVSIQDLRQDPQDTSNFYLANIYQLLADPNRSNISTSLPTAPPPFSPPTFAVWVNGLWFLSLVISITCAVLATLLQQWARRYLKVTQTRYGLSLHKRARIRSFFAEGVKNSLLPWAVEALPVLLHVSLVLFFAGLAVFLWNVDLTIFKVVLSWIGVCTALYGCTMLISIVLRDSPYYTPLTPLALPVICVIGYVIFVALSIPFSILSTIWTFCFCCRQPFRLLEVRDRFRRFVVRRVKASIAPEKAALESPPELDTRALMWTFNRLDEDHELVRFFSGLPGFHASKVVEEPLRGLGDEQKLKLLTAIIRFLDRTLSSDLLSDRVKRQRADICGKAIDLLDTPEAFRRILCGLASDSRFYEPVSGPVQSTKILQFVRCWRNRKGEDTTPVTKALFSIAVARVQRHDDSWFILASDEMAIPVSDLRSHAAHGDSLSLVILIHVMRQQFIYLWAPPISWLSAGISRALRSASKFDVQDTSPELQHEFCALWNQMVRKARNNNDRNIAWHILGPLRGVYIALHQGTDSAPTNFPEIVPYYTPFPPNDRYYYPVCNDPSHILDESTPTTFPRTIQQHVDPPAIASLTSPDAPSSSVLASPHVRVDEIIAAVPPLDNPRPTHQPADSVHIPLTSLDPSNAGAIQDIVASGITTSDPTPDASTSAPHSSTSPPDVIFLQDKAVLLTSSDSPDLPSPASSLVRDNILPTESTVASAPSASLALTSGRDPDTSAEDDGSPMPGFHNEMDSLDPSSVHNAFDTNTTPTTVLPPRPPSPPLVTESDVATLGRSERGPNVENTGDRPPDHSRYQYDIV